MKTLNWCYGAKSPDLTEAVDSALLAAHRYRNRLCELELAKRDRHYEILRTLAPKYLAAENAVTAAEALLAEDREKIQSERVKQRVKKPLGVEGIAERVQQTKSMLKELRANRKQAKLDAYADEIVAAAMADNTEKHKADCKAAKIDSGLYWGTEAVISQSCRSFASGAPPRFKRYDGTGQLAVQLQGGLDCRAADNANTLCYLGEVDGKFRECFMRIGSDGRSPVFAKFKIVFHRDLPEGRIKWAYLERRRMADQYRWTLRLTIDVESERDSQVLPGEVAVHTGWRMEPDGLRVATWFGSDGKTGVFRLPNWHCNDYERLAQTRSKRDTAFNEIKSEIRDWLKGENDLPEFLAEARKTLHSWKSPAKLAGLCWRWLDAGPDASDEPLGRLELWRKQDKKRWQHERRLALRISRRRKDMFRNFVADLSNQYGVVIVSPFDVQELNLNSTPEDLQWDNSAAHRHSNWAATSELITMIGEKFDIRCIKVESKGISQQCTKCGESDSVGQRKRQCTNCGRTEDVDTRAAVNTFARGEVLVKSGEVLANAERERLKEVSRQEKLAKMQAANRAARKRNCKSVGGV